MWAPLFDGYVPARQWLEDASGETGLLGRISRLATLRRLRRQAGEVGGLAFDAVFDAEAADEDIFEDERWNAIAATRDAVLAAIEAVRHDAFPHLSDASSDASESERREGRHRGGRRCCSRRRGVGAGLATGPLGAGFAR